ncbi:MAG: hypothetical protein H0U52_16085 [Chloroflexi bacterium]|nr:hypothetical protein [Chloroflexota bacterium]
MDDDDVASDELLPSPDLLADDLPVVGDDLEVQARDEGAGVALAGRCLLDIAQAATEPKVAALDRVLELGRIDGLGDRVDERGVALQLRQSERWSQPGDDRAHEVGQDVLSVIELGTGEEAGVAADVGDDEAGGFGLAEHDGSPSQGLIIGRPAVAVTGPLPGFVGSRPSG